MNALLPRLDRESVEALLIGMTACNAAGEPTQELSPRVTYAPSGGAPATPSQVQEMRAGLRQIALACGWNNAQPRPSTARFDALASAWLASCPLLQSGEAHRDDTWACLATCVAPELVLWRFGPKPERFHGGIRNTFQRLWIRGRLLDRGPEAGEARWGLLHELSEDALVAISERPSIAADRRLARAIAEGWVRSAARIGREKMESVMREATLSLRLKNELALLSMLVDPVLERVVDAAFVRVEGGPVDQTLG